MKLRSDVSQSVSAIVQSSSTIYCIHTLARTRFDI